MFCGPKKKSGAHLPPPAAAPLPMPPPMPLGADVSTCGARSASGESQKKKTQQKGYLPLTDAARCDFAG
jgi:hypothetical protein